MVPTSARCMPHPAHELRQLPQLEALTVMVVNQEHSEGLNVVRISPHRVRRSPQPVNLLHSHHVLPPQRGTSRHGRSSLRSPRPCRRTTSKTTTDNDFTTCWIPSSWTSLTASEGLKISRELPARRCSPLRRGGGVPAFAGPSRL